MKSGKRHTLRLFYERFHAHRAMFLIGSLIFFGLYLAINFVPFQLKEIQFTLVSYAWILLVIGSAAFLIFLYRTVASYLPYVQCTERNLKIRTPFYSIVISYKRIQETRPNALFEIFKKDAVSRSQAHFLEKFAGQTVVVVDMNSFPMSLRWMKFWMGDLMFTPDDRSLVLWVGDWMSLNRELADYLDRWRAHKSGKPRPPVSVYSQMKRGS
jgi:hypothetical protein